MFVLQSGHNQSQAGQAGDAPRLLLRRAAAVRNRNIVVSSADQSRVVVSLHIEVCSVDNYFLISSGCGTVVPRHIIITPFLYNREVKGIIELGTTKEFSTTILTFLDQVSESIAVAFNTAQIRVKMQELLKATQQQADKLQQQQETLRLTNEELEAQTKELEQQQKSLEEKNDEVS